MGIIADKINDSFSRAADYASNATEQAGAFIERMSNLLYEPPKIDVKWTSLTPPSIAPLPSTPNLPEISFDDPSELRPAELSVTPIDISIPSFDEPAPELHFPTAPVLNYGTMPDVPAPRDVEIPDAPVLTTPDVPTLLSIRDIAFGGINLHEDWLDKLENIPTLTLAAPTPYTYNRGPAYASALLELLQEQLQARLRGGTGLNPAVEQAIWDRARDREVKAAQANEQEILRASEALGFKLPTGVQTAQLREAQQNFYDKVSELSRDIAIKQAELEQANLKDTIAAGMQLESQLIDYSFKMEQLSFETAKALADNAIQTFNAQVEQYKALLAGYETYASAYRTLIEAEKAKVEVYRAELAAEETKAQINQAMVEQYKAMIEAGMSQVKVFEAQVGAANTLVQLEQTRIAAAGEQIRAYVAQANVETSKVEAYKAQIQAEATKNEAYSTRASAFGAKVAAEAERARAEVSRHNALVTAYTARWEGYRAAVAAETMRMEALGKQSGAMLDGYRAGTSAAVAQAEMNTKVWETNIQQYKAGIDVAVQTAKINGDYAMMAMNAQLDASKVGAQTFAQLAASAYNMVGANVSLSGSNSWSVNNSLSGDLPDGITFMYDP